MRTRILAVASVLVAGAAAVPAADGAAAGGRCTAHAYGSLALTPSVVVFAGPQDDAGASRIYACRKPAGAPVLLGIDEPDDGQYGSDSVVGRITVAGTWVAAELDRGAASASMCSKVMPGDPVCPRATTSLRVVDTRTRRATEVATGTVDALALSTAGAVAWLAGDTLRGTALRPRGRRALTAAPAELDRGAITKLRFERGRLLRWRSGGAPRSASL